MLKDNRKKIFYTSLILIIVELLIHFLYPHIGSQIGSLSIFPALVIAWLWGPVIGITAATLIIIITALNFFAAGMPTHELLRNRFVIILPIILSGGVGYLKILNDKNKHLTKKLELEGRNLETALDEKINAEKILLQKIEFIKFANKISSDFINIPPLLIESRIESSIQHIFDFIEADSSCIYIQLENNSYFSLYKEFNKKNNSGSYVHLYRIETGVVSDLYETFISQTHIEIDRRYWNHPILEIFKSPSVILLPLLSNNSLFGLISFECMSYEKDWSIYQQEIFPLCKQVIAYAFERKFAEEKIMRQYDELKSYSESLEAANLKLNRLNETLIQTGNELKESENKFRELSENLEDIIWLQAGRKVLYVNPAYEKILGKSRDNLYKNSFDFLDIIHPEDKKELIRTFSKHNYDDKKVFQSEFRITDGKDNIKWIAARSFLISSENGILKIAGIAEDITLRKKAEEEIKIALDKAIELNQLKSRFISTVSHELRTPLATILSSIELMQLYEKDLSDDEKSKHYSKIISSIDYLTTLLDDVITIDKSESGVVGINVEEFELISLIKEIIENIRIIKHTNVNVVLQAEPDTLAVNTDKKLLTQVINNLITNAVKFSHPESTVTVKIKTEHDKFVLHVNDEGIGIPIECQANIFVPFFRASNAQNIQGTGLGLSISKRWVHLLNGAISFKSKVKSGTTFTVILPINSRSTLN